MANEIIVNKQTLQIKQYNGQNVVTFKDIDLCHERPEGTASRNFRKNKQHFVEGTDYFRISPDEFRRTIGNMDKRQNNEVVLITESGYYMIVKSFTDELSWAVQRELVNSYFKYKEEKADETATVPYEYFDKTWKGEPVLTARDVQHLTGICRTTAVAWLKHNGVKLVDYYFLSGKDLTEFKTENPRIAKSVRSLCVISKYGFTDLCKAYGIKTEKPKCFGVPQTRKTFAKEVTEIKEKLVAINVILDRLMEFDEHYSSNPATKSISDKYSESFLNAVNNLCMAVSIDISTLGKSYCFAK